MIKQALVEGKCIAEYEIVECFWPKEHNSRAERRMYDFALLKVKKTKEYEPVEEEYAPLLVPGNEETKAIREIEVFGYPLEVNKKMS